jgi:hypothetical protein
MSNSIRRINRRKSLEVEIEQLKRSIAQFSLKVFEDMSLLQAKNDLVWARVRAVQKILEKQNSEQRIGIMVDDLAQMYHEKILVERKKQNGNINDVRQASDSGSIRRGD